MEWFQNLLINLMEADTWVQYLSVFLISIVPFFESYVAIPIGIIFGFPSIQVVLIGAVGNWLSVMVFIWVISGLRKKVVANKSKDSKRKNRAQNIFKKIWCCRPILCRADYLLSRMCSDFYCIRG